MRTAGLSDGRNVLPVFLGALALSLAALAVPTSAAEPVQPPARAAANPAYASRAPSPALATPTPAQPVVRDVALGRDGVLRGRVIATSAEPLWVTIKSAGGPQPGGVTVAVDNGQFAVAGLRRGLYSISVSGGEPSAGQVVRVWEAGVAPPSAAAEIVLAADVPVVVRGQRPVSMPVVSLKQAALYSGIVGGAVATPIIYHNARMQNRVPASP